MVMNNLRARALSCFSCNALCENLRFLEGKGSFQPFPSRTPEPCCPSESPRELGEILTSGPIPDQPVQSEPRGEAWALAFAQGSLSVLMCRGVENHDLVHTLHLIDEAMQGSGDMACLGEALRLTRG